MINVVAIEDDPAILDNIIDTLEAEGLVIVGVCDGREGLDLVEKELPDLVICDIMIPSINGFDVLQRLRAQARTADIPFVFLTARSERENVRRGMELGADDYLSKPFTSAELVATVTAQLRKRTTIAQKYESNMKVLRSNIIYALPHELRTPMMSILGYSDILQQEAQNITADDVADMAATIHRSGERLEAVFENYLVYAQLEIMSGDSDEIQKLRNHVLDNPNDIIATTATKRADRHKRKTDLKLVLNNTGSVRISTENLAKLVDVLVDNAFKFSTADSTVSVGCACVEGKFCLKILDAGRGMSVDQIKNLGAYMQFGRALHEQQGLGLGFIIARKIVEYHSGTIEIKSVVGKGTLITVYLPLD